MQKILYLFLFLSLFSCKKEEIKAHLNSVDTLSKKDSAVINPMAHVMDSATTAGQTFSAIENKKINVKKEGLILHSMTELSTEKSYVIFNPDQSEAEIFLPNAAKGYVLSKKPEDTLAQWNNKDYILIKNQDYNLYNSAHPDKILFSSKKTK